MPRYPSAQVAAVAQRHKVVIRDHQMVQKQNVHDVECLLQAACQLHILVRLSVRRRLPPR